MLLDGGVAHMQPGVSVRRRLQQVPPLTLQELSSTHLQLSTMTISSLEGGADTTIEDLFFTRSMPTANAEVCDRS